MSVVVALLETARVSEPELARLHALLPPEERAAAERMADARTHVCARAHVRRCLSHERPAVPETAWTFSRTEAGKPFVTGPTAFAPPLDLSLSHTDGLVVCAVASAPVGVDAEPLARAPEILETVLRAFAPPEVAALLALAPAERERRAVELWTVKEAYLKALGTGIARHLDRLVVRRDGRSGDPEGLWRLEETEELCVRTRAFGDRWVVATAAGPRASITYRSA